MADSSLSHPTRSHDIFSQNLKELHFRLAGMSAYLLTLVAEGPSDCPKMSPKSRQRMNEVFAELWEVTQDVKRLLPRPPA